jgi:hypothetical protein
MATYSYKARKSVPVDGTVEATSREEAIAAVIKTAAPGEEIAIMDVQVAAKNATAAA